METDPLAGVAPPPDLYRVGALAKSVDALEALRPAHYERFAHDGFLAVDQALSPAEVVEALEGLQSLIQRENPSGYMLQFEGGRAAGAALQGEARMDAVRKLMGFVGAEPRLQALADHPGILAVVARLIGATPRLIQDMALIKPPGGGREKPWHQDMAYFNYPVEARVVGVWIALDATDVANGCMHVFPASHRAGPAPHFQIRDWQLCDADVQGLPCTAVPLPAGGALFFDGLLHHGTPPNFSGKRRRALQFHYIAADAVPTDPEARLRNFGAEGRNATC